jgi:hypothetical protein
LTIVAGLAACSSAADDAGIEATSVPAPGLAVAECVDLARAAVSPLQEFVDQYDVLTVAEWNAIDPPPDIAPAQDEVAVNGRAAIERGCDPAIVEAGIEAAIANLDSAGEVGAAIVGALTGEEPLDDSAALQRDAEPTSVVINPGDDLSAILSRVAEGSTLEFAAGTHEFDSTIIVDVGVRLVGVSRATTRIRSSASGAALVFLGPGALEVADLTIEHVGDLPASVMLAIAGPVAINGVELRGGIAGDAEAGGGHGLVFAFDPLPGFPERTPAERAGALVVADSAFVDNERAGVLATGDARPAISGSLVTGNGGCGLCYLDTSGGPVADTTIEGNRIGVQAGDDSAPSIINSSITANSDVGLSIFGASDVDVLGSAIARNGDIAIQVAGTSTSRFAENVIDEHLVGVLATDDAELVLGDNDITNSQVGVQVDGRVMLDVHDNRISAAEIAGLSLAGESAGSVRNNVLEAMPVAGIQIFGAATPDVSGTTISGPGEVGVSFVESAGGSATGNVIAGREIGVQVGGGASPDIVGNTIIDSGVVGILYGDDASGSATSNNISGGDSFRIVVGGSAAPELSDNELNGGEVVRQPGS